VRLYVQIWLKTRELIDVAYHINSTHLMELEISPPEMQLRSIARSDSSIPDEMVFSLIC